MVSKILCKEITAATGEGLGFFWTLDINMIDFMSISCRGQDWEQCLEFKDNTTKHAFSANILYRVILFTNQKQHGL